MIIRNLKLEADCLKAFSPPIDILRPDMLRSGVIFASPHSGSLYPASFIARSALSETELRRNEDAYIDKLFSPAAQFGAPLLSARFPRLSLIHI